MTTHFKETGGFMVLRSCGCVEEIERDLEADRGGRGYHSYPLRLRRDAETHCRDL